MGRVTVFRADLRDELFCFLTVSTDLTCAMNFDRSIVCDTDVSSFIVL